MKRVKKRGVLKKEMVYARVRQRWYEGEIKRVREIEIGMEGEKLSNDQFSKVYFS